MKFLPKVLFALTFIFLIISCSDDEEVSAVIGTLENDVINLNFSPSQIMRALEEEYASDFTNLSVDSIYFTLEPDNFLWGEGTHQFTDVDGSVITAQFITRVPFKMEGANLLMTPEDMNRGESCSGNPCAQCIFEANGAGCCCVGGGTICNHTISRFAHSKTEQGGLNNFFEC